MRAINHFINKIKIFKIKFEKWFQNLTVIQVLVFWITLIFCLFVIIRNNPIEGYTLSYTYIKTASIKESNDKWSNEDPDKNAHISYWKYEAKYYAIKQQSEARMMARESSKTAPQAVLDGFVEVTGPTEIADIKAILKDKENEVFQKLMDNWEPEAGFYYRKKNPIWWIYAYQSEAYKDWEWSDDYNDNPILRFKTLGGLINFLVIALICSKILMWLVGIRSKTLV